MSRSDTAALRVQEAFTHLMRWVQRGDVRQALLGAAAPAMSTNDITLLRAVATHGPMRASELAAWQGVDKSTITPQVRRLEERGLVARAGDPGDKRAALLTVTEAGRQQLQDVDEQGARLFGQALQGWSDNDREAVGTLMQRLAEGLVAVPHHSDRNVRRPAG